MKVGIGIPNQVRNMRPNVVPAWARLAEESGFASLTTVGRQAYPGLSDTVALAAAAAVTSRIELISGVLLATTWPGPLLAKELAGIDGVSGGRLTLGLGVGQRPDDFVAEGYGSKGPATWSASPARMANSATAHACAGGRRAATSPGLVKGAAAQPWTLRAAGKPWACWPTTRMFRWADARWRPARVTEPWSARGAAASRRSARLVGGLLLPRPAPPRPGPACQSAPAARRPPSSQATAGGWVGGWVGGRGRRGLRPSVRGGRHCADSAEDC